MTATDWLALAAIVIAILGWGTSYWFTIRANKDVLRRTLLNEARNEFCGSLRDFIDWMSAVVSLVGSHKAYTEVEVLRPYLPEKTKELVPLTFDSRSYIWLRVLEEYEGLIPESVGIRGPLTSMVNSMLETLRTATNNEDVVNACDEITEQMAQLTGLAWDLRAFLQNKLFGDLTGHIVKRSPPADFTGPYLAFGYDGMLVIKGAFHSTTSRSPSSLAV